MLSWTTVTTAWHILNVQIEETANKKARALGRGLIPPHHVNTNLSNFTNCLAQRRFRVTQTPATVCCPYDLK